jgi:hypothetical protein
VPRRLRGLNVETPRRGVLETDAFESVENAIGSPFGDVLTGDAGANRLEGGPGADTVLAGAGADRVEVRDGERDGVTCGADADSVVSDPQTLEAVGPDCEAVEEPAPTPPEPPGTPDPSGTPNPSGTPDPSGTPQPSLSLSVTGARSQRLLRRKAVRVQARCSVACTTTATALGKARAAKRVLAAGVVSTLELRLRRAQLTALRRALASGKRPVLRIVVEARDAAGNRAARTLRVRARA